jgi:3-deoxy-manno-octulosonate cytidylyltransferase (CMP-KDO synthetase)
MLQHVYERASMARYLTSTIIATDDQRVFDAARAFGAPVRMTRRDHLSGTDRVAEVASAEIAAIIVNIQADEPLIDPAAIDAAILPVAQDDAIVMSTLKKRIEDPREIDDPNVVKVVANHAGDAIYFSRCPIPYNRERGAGSNPLGDPQRDPLNNPLGGPKNNSQGNPKNDPLGNPKNDSQGHPKAERSERLGTGQAMGLPHGGRAAYFKHIGLYVYQRDFLLNYSLLPVGPLERAERLEQLRALENGYSIRVVETEYESFGVDTPEDLERVSRLFEATVI